MKIKNGILKAKFSGRSGITMVELIVAMAISLVVVAAAGFILLSQSGVFRMTKSVSVEQERLNNAFNAVKYSLRMAGFDYGTQYYAYAAGAQDYHPAVPVQVNYQANGVLSSYPVVYPPTTTLAGNIPLSPTDPPYEVLISYSYINNPACTITNSSQSQCGSTFNLGSACNLKDFHEGTIINIANVTFCPKSTISASQVSTICLTQVMQSNKIQANPGQGGHDCPANEVNYVPPTSISGGTALVIKQFMYYWGNTAYSAPLDSNNNPLPSTPGTLYECTLNTPVNFPDTPVCLANTVVALDENVVSFSVTTLSLAAGSPYVNSLEQPYVYVLSISGTSSVAVTGSSPAFSVNTQYNKSLSGSNPIQGTTIISGYNVIKTLSANIFSKNIFYEK